MPPSKKNLKGTKKFAKTHLKDTLERRKATAKIKQRQQIKQKQQGKRSKDAEFLKSGKGDSSARGNGPKKERNVSSMSVDDFFQGGFEILEKGEPEKKAPGKLGKRKRDDQEIREQSESEVGSAFSAEEEPEAFGSDNDDESGEEGDEDAGMTKKTLDDLAKKDPEFYKFLKENDPEALEFDENEDLPEFDDLSGGEEDSEDEQPKKKRKKSKQNGIVEDEVKPAKELTQEVVATWKGSMTDKHSLRAAREVVVAFRGAAFMNEDEVEGKRSKYKISSPAVFHDVLIAALTQIPVVIEHHLKPKTSASGKVYVDTQSKNFQSLSGLIKTYTASVIQLLGTLSDDGTLKLTISSLEPMLPYLLTFRKLLKVLLKSVINFWAQTSSSDATRITAFRLLDKLVRVGDRGIREQVLKATYQGLIQGCRVTNANTIQGINLMKNSAAQLWGIDQGIGYTTAFTFIRQLAIHLRNSIAHNKNNAFRIVYNWQYAHSLDFWSRMLSEHCSSVKEAEDGKESQLKLLIYPLVQVTLGAMGLIPTATYFPLRFQLTRSLLRLSRATGTYIPLAASLLEVLNSTEMKKPPKSSTQKPLDFNVAYKAPKALLRTRVYQDGVGEQVVELFGEYFVLWTKSIAFPELALPVTIQLKRWIKQAKSKTSGNKNGKLASNVILLVQKLEANGKFIEERRAKVDFAPKDRAQVDAFLRELNWERTPLGAYVSAQRKVKEERNRAIAEARKEDDKKKKLEREEKLAAEGEDLDMDSDAEEESMESDGMEEDEDEE
jgi:nucleolar complex protein 2